MLRKGRDQQPQAFELLGIEDAVEQLEVVADVDQLALGHVAEVGASGEEDRRRKLRQEMLGQIEIQVEARQVAVLDLLHLVDLKLREDHAAFGMIGMWQGHEAEGEALLLANLLGAQPGQFVPARAVRQLDPHAALDRFAACHLHAIGGLVGKVVALFEQFTVALHDPGLVAGHALHDRVEAFGDDHRRVAGGDAVGFGGLHGGQREAHGQREEAAVRKWCVHLLFSASGRVKPSEGLGQLAGNEK
ncbi:hypothetical protein D3C77_467020 [compost metagenome]